MNAMLIFYLLAEASAIHWLICILAWRWRWAVFVPGADRPPILNQAHGDFTFFRFLSRALTAWISDKLPVKLIGNVRGHLDIPAPGCWVLAFPLFFAFTTKGGLHGRIGMRYDYIDGYYVLSISLKRLKIAGSRGL